jgi:hypothetical protein
MEEKARDLKAAGQRAEAEKVMSEALELRAKLERMAPREGEGPAVVERRLDLRRKRAELQNELKRQVAEGREVEAAELRQQIERLDQEFNGAAGGRGEPQLGRRDGLRPGGRPGSMDAARRLEHLQRAVENLRAGGMPDLAARLEQQGQRIRERLDRGGPRGVPFEEIERLRGEVRELHQAMQELKRRLEEVARRQP